MSPGRFIEAWTSSSDFCNRNKQQTVNRNIEEKTTAEDFRLKLDASSISSKLDFFRSIGLEFSSCCDINCYNNNNNNIEKSKNNNDSDNVDNDLETSSLSDRMAENFDDVPEENFSWKSRSENRNTKNSGIHDMVDYHKLIPHIRECSVMIVGEKCKTCGRSFKCIKDVQIHVKKKHRRKKPRKKLVLKIGNEVISRLPIKRKHLRWNNKKRKTVELSSDDAVSLSNEEGQNSFDQLSDEEMAPYIDTNHNCYPNTADSLFTDSDESVIELENSKDTARLKMTKHCESEEDEIQVLLKITRPRQSMEINHETPNRFEREQLISDAIREFIRLDSEIAELDGPTSNLNESYRENDDIIEEYSRLASSRLPICNLNSEENNCSFHIENEEDFDCGIPEVNSFLPANNDRCNDKIVSPNPHEYRNENGDLIPDFIDYTRCLDDRISRNSNNNNVDDLDSLFYNEDLINEWNKPLCVRKPLGFGDIRQNTSRSLGSSVLIKEEIMLDDIL